MPRIAIPNASAKHPRRRLSPPIRKSSIAAESAEPRALDGEAERRADGDAAANCIQADMVRKDPSHPMQRRHDRAVTRRYFFCGSGSTAQKISLITAMTRRTSSFARRNRWSCRRGGYPPCRHSEAAQLLRHRRLPQRQDVFELGHAPLALGEQAQQQERLSCDNALRKLLAFRALRINKSSSGEYSAPIPKFGLDVRRKNRGHGVSSLPGQSSIQLGENPVAAFKSYIEFACI